MKKPFAKSALMALALATSLYSCGDSDSNSGGGEPKPKEVQVTANLTNTENVGASWLHTLLLFKGNELAETATSKDASFTVSTESTYTMMAVILEKITNLVLPESFDAEAVLKIKNTNSAIPVMMVGSSESKEITESTALTVPMMAITAQANFKITDAPANVDKITVKLNGLNDQINIKGEVSASSADLFKTITLTKGENGFSGSAVVLPTSSLVLKSSAAEQTITYTIMYNDGTPTYTRTVSVEGGFIPNQEVNIDFTMEDLTIYGIPAITYSPWGTTNTANGDFEIEAPGDEDVWDITSNANAQVDVVGELSYLMDGDASTVWEANGWDWNKSIFIDMKKERKVKEIVLTNGFTTFWFFQLYVSNEPIIIDGIPEDGDANNLGFDGYPTFTVPAAQFSNGGNNVGRYVTIVFNNHGNGWENLCNMAEIKINLDEE